MTTVEKESNELMPSPEKVSKSKESPKNLAVFSEGKSKITDSLEKATDPIRTELETLRELQKMNPALEREQQIFDLERKRKRSMSFAFLQAKWAGTPEQKTEQKKILEGKDSLEKLKASDVLFLKKKWVDLANIFLVPKNDPTGSVSRDTLKKDDSFIVNFGENKNINHVIGAGDILPPTVSQIRINGVEGERKYDPRPGYYAKGKYLPIFDGDTIEIISLRKVTEEENTIATTAENKWFRERRLDDIVDNNGNALSEFEEDKNLEKEAQMELTEMKKRREKYAKYSPENKNRFLETFGEVLDRETSRYGIPKDMLVNNLFEKENSSFDPFCKNPKSSAYGLGQIIDETWKSISLRMNRRLDRQNPEDQIIATCEYLNYIKELRGCSWGEAIVYYHTGENFDNRHVREAMAVNTPIVKWMKNPETPTAKDYVTAAAKYYEVTEYMNA